MHTAIAVLAVTLGMVDSQARFHGLAEFTFPNESKITAVVRVEDLSHRAYSNRFHLLIQTVNAYDLPGFAPSWFNVTVMGKSGSMQVTIPGWGSVTVWPLDPEIGQAMQAGGGETRWQRVTLTRLDKGYYELLVEEPLTQ